MPHLDDVPGLAALRAQTLGDPNVIVALLDGAVDVEHPCFEGARFRHVHVDWTDDHEPLSEFPRHGTGIASQLFGQPGANVEGVVPHATGLLVRSAVGVNDIHEWGLARAIEHALNAGANIIHCAFCLPRGLPSAKIGDLLRRAIHKAHEAGVLIVAPSGNNAGDCTCSPADQPHVLAVGGLNDDGSVRHTSNHGPGFEGHGVMAWAQNVTLAEPGGATEVHSGTSVAAPWVTGTAALLLSLARAEGHDLNSVQIGEIIRRTARSMPIDAEGRDRAFGGVLAPDLALDALRGTSLRPVVASNVTPSHVSPSLRFPARVYALGQLHAEPRDDAAAERLRRSMQQAGRPEGVEGEIGLLAHLTATPNDRDLVHWVLRIGGEARYAIMPVGAHADAVVQRLVDLASASVGIPAIPATVDRIIVPGLALAQHVTLRRGETVRKVMVRLPEALLGWRTDDLVAAAVDALGRPSQGPTATLLAQLLDHVSEGRLNDGLLAADRALNHNGVNALQLAMVAEDMQRLDAQFIRLEVLPSRYDRPRSECWDVRAYFRDPYEPYRAWWQWVWTVDVSDERPVTLNTPRCWRVPPIPLFDEVMEGSWS